MSMAPEEKRRQELNQQLASLFAKLGPIQDALSAITRTAQAESWDMARYASERTVLREQKDALGEEIKQAMAELTAIDQKPPQTVPPVLAPVPTFIRFSRISDDLSRALSALNAVFDRWNCTLRQLVHLRPSSGEDDGGLAYAGEPCPMTLLSEVVPSLHGSEPFALICLARDPGARFNFVVFNRSENEFALTLDVSPKMVVYETPERERGRWLDGLLTSIVGAFEPLACSYGTTPPNELEYESIDPALLLASLRTGKLLQLTRPVFHALSVKLIELTEIRTILAEHASTHDPDYRMAPGYHLLGHVGV